MEETTRTIFQACFTETSNPTHLLDAGRKIYITCRCTQTASRTQGPDVSSRGLRARGMVGGRGDPAAHRDPSWSPGGGRVSSGKSAPSGVRPTEVRPITRGEAHARQTGRGRLQLGHRHARAPRRDQGLSLAKRKRRRLGATSTHHGHTSPHDRSGVSGSAQSCTERGGRPDSLLTFHSLCRQPHFRVRPSEAQDWLLRGAEPGHSQ